jgi:undecaprenyl-diphosphatase
MSGFKAWEPRVLGSLLVIAVAAWAFLVIADRVTDGETHRTDVLLLRALRRADDITRLRGPHWLGEVVRDLTAIGGYAMLSLMTAAVVGFLFLSGRPRDARFVLTAVVGGWVLAYGLKFLFDRPRPDIVPHLSDVGSSSFPSGHSLMSAVVYLTLGSLLTTVVSSTRLKWYFLAVALVLTVLVGISRVCLGVHYPSDVLAGWSLGLAWAEACWLAHSFFIERRGARPQER